MAKLWILILGILLFLLHFDNADAWPRRRRRRRTPPPVDTGAPYFTDCPSEKIIKSSTTPTTEATWKEPTAYDSFQGGYVPVERYGKGPGSEFGEGDHYTTYTARDNAGNQANCQVHINVNVLRCPTLSHPANGFIICSNGVSVGSECKYYCSTGYALNFEATRECNEYEEWTFEEPACNQISCPSDEIVAPTNGEVTCTDGSKHQSICTFTCQDGFAIPPNESRERICTTTGWTGTQPLCQDSSAPDFDTCPSSQIVYAGDLETTAVVTWDVPTASDNSGEEVVVVQTQGLPPGSRFTQNYHVIEYTATDSSDMFSTCTFTIAVQVIMCRSVPIYPGLLVSCPNGNIRGSECSFACTTGYRLDGTDSITCQKVDNAGEWTDSAPICVVLECPDVDAPENGDYAGGQPCQRSYGSSCYFTCNAGYYIDNNVLRCNAQPGSEDAWWEGTQPTCTVKMCDVPSLDDGMQYDMNTTCADQGEVEVGEECGFECDVGYNLYGTDVLTCGLSGEWQQQSPVCEVVTCISSDIPSPSHGIKSGCPNENENYGTVCRFSCDVGYLPSESIYRTCLDDGDGSGVWSGGPVSCTVVQCDPLDVPANGYVDSCRLDGDETSVSNKQDYGTMCNVLCNLGYTAQGAISRRCQADGEWDGIAQSCIDVTPPYLECPADRVIFAQEGQAKAELHWEDWEPVKATDGSLQITATLASIDFVPVSSYNRPAFFDEGSHTISYRATDAAGFTSTCSFEIDVKVTRCPPLYAPSNGDVTLNLGQGSCEGGAVYGSSCLIMCDMGYIIADGNVTTERYCLRSSDTSTVGYWNGTRAECDAVTCPVPDILNGHVSGCPPIVAQYQDQCEFACDDGYRSSNSESVVMRSCLANTSWSDPEPLCDIIVTCPANLNLKYGSVTPDICTLPDPVTFDTECNFQCDSGFRMYGPYSKVCTADGTWNDQRNVVCEDVQAPMFDNTCPMYVYENAEKKMTSAIVVYDEITATDNSGNATVIKVVDHVGRGFRFNEGSTTIPYIATDRSGNSANCEVIVSINVFRCPRLQAPSSGSIANCSDPVYGAQCTFSCNEGYELSGSSSRECVLPNGQAPASWDGTQPTCQVKTCEALSTSPLAIKSGCTALPPDTEPYGTLCSFYCPHGYSGVGESQKRCQADGTWSSINFTCEATSCEPLTPNSTRMQVTPSDCMDEPSFGETCLLGCDTEGYAVEPQDYTYTSCLGNGEWSRDITQAQCEDFQSPIFTVCPYDFTVYASRGAYTANVTWSIDATDNDGQLPLISCNMQQGMLGEGDYSVTCVAMDIAGNSARCSFDVSVKIRRCAALSPPAFGGFSELTPCDNTWGSRCVVTCSVGHNLVGPEDTTCEYDGVRMFWDRVSTPYCDESQCSALTLPTGVGVYPGLCTGTGKLYYGTSCSFFCGDGLSLEGDVEPVNCLSNGTWDRTVNENSTISCVDRVSPTLLYCPGPITTTRTEVWGVEVTFDIPSARDNVDDDLDVVTFPDDLSSPYNFTVDTLCVYEFFDESGNSVTCAFQIYVEDALAPIVVYCPEDLNVTASQPLTEVTWDEPEFEEVTGDELIITCNFDDNTVDLPWGAHVVIYTATNTDNGKVSICQFVVDVRPIPCLRLDPPGNGALACDTWEFGRFCSMFCNQNYDIPRQSSSVEPPNLYVCGTSGIWTPHANVPDCSEVRRPGRSNLPSELLYYSGTCGDDETNQEIADNFLIVIGDSQFDDVCADEQECNVQNVEVTCGPVSGGLSIRRRGIRERGRQRRQLQRVEATIARGSTVSKRNVHAQQLFEYSIYWEFAVNVNQDPSLSNWDAALDAEDLMIQMVDVVQDSIDAGTLPAPSVPGVDLDLIEDSLAYGYSQPECASAYIADNSDLHCSACTTGTYYNNSTKECLPCPQGSYQDEQAMMFCNACPEGQWTAEEGATNSSYCKDMCMPGTSSNTGVVPCYRCDFGFYESEPLSTNCTLCPNQTTTLQKGSNSSDSCVALCEPGHRSNTGIAPCTKCPIGSFQPSKQMTFCIECPANTTTVAEGATLGDLCQDINECNSQPCQNNATCMDKLESYSCLCAPGFSGDNCEVNIDECGSYPCLNGATCIDGINTYNCQCTPGYEGSGCDRDIDECLLSPCQNNGTCINYDGYYVCLCMEGFHGHDCEQEINACSPDPCLNGATCEIFPGDVLGYRCICSPGYTNLNCSRNINECGSDPCFNGGLCKDEIARYSCDCPNGYGGDRCEVDIDLCANITCENNATCVDFGSYYICSCTSRYAGDFCERNKTVCDGIPCQNGGNCTNLSDNDFSCECPTGYGGKICEILIDACYSGPCSNDALCSTDGLGQPVCVCLPGYDGSFCEDEINECMSHPCGNNGTCIDKIASYECHCTDGWEAPDCAVKTNFCEDDPCDNGGTCMNVEDAYVCVCPPGYKGVECEVKVALCSSEPCYNGGSCQENLDAFHCLCLPGFTGDFCEINRNECESMPCLNNGTCVDELAFYRCVCPMGYTGLQCEQIIYPCLDSPCNNGGTCSHMAPGVYKCFCPQGFTGQNCDTDIDECSSFPCFNAEACEDGPNGYSCICKAGFGGTHCELDIDECSSAPCQNNATCVNLPGNFSCDCLPGYDGIYCENDIDECMQQPCLNGATCVDELNAFNCICAPGFIGTTCQVVEAPQCYPTNPCQNGATCTGSGDGAGYVCSCLAGFTGTLCEVNIDECIGNLCTNGATCIDKVNGYVCRCQLGYDGDLCDVNPDDCSPNQCENNAVCIDLLNGFTCNCTKGFEGTLCQTDVNECESTPCLHGGTCTDEEGFFSCNCESGYSGDMCEMNIDDCAGDPCHNGANCLDGLDSFTCLCAPGFTGELCENVLPSNYDFIFVASNPLLVREEIFSQGPPTVLSLSLWIRTVSSPPSFRLLRLEDKTTSNIISIENPCSLRVTINSQIKDTNLDLCDYEWYHIFFTWDVQTTGQWELRVNNSFLERGSNVASLSLEDVLSIGAAQMDVGHLVFLSSYNLWSLELNEESRSELSSSCLSGLFGNLISWTELVVEVTESNQLLTTSPSLCDSFDECLSNPCQYEGTCTNLPNMFTCTCKDGFTGLYCEGFVDICEENHCQNDGTCATVEGQLICTCLEGFSGDHCEFEIVDGGWSGWSPWTECPVTCGGDVHYRYRECNNPEPQNGGLPCSGAEVEEQPCNTQECPGCVELRRPLNGYLYCEETPTLIICTMECREGYEPENSKYEREEYFCGEETNYRWNHQTPLNPSARLPSCVEVQRATEANGFSSVDYPTSICQSLEEKQAIEDAFTNLLLTYEQEFQCLTTGTCQIESIEALNCESVTVNVVGRRRKRAADSGVTVMVTTLQNLTYGDEPGSQPLDYFLEAFEKLVSDDSLVLTVDDQVLEPNKSSLSNEAFQKCPPGYLTALDFGYCVPCGPGTYEALLPTEIERECNPCPVDTYQDGYAQTECIHCPNGTVTAEPYSSNISDCFVPEVVPPVTSVPGLEKSTKIIISVTTVTAALLVVVAILIWYFFYYRPRAKVSSDANDSQPSESYNLQVRGKTTPATDPNQGSKGSLSTVDVNPGPSPSRDSPTGGPRPKSAFDVHEPLEEYNPGAGGGDRTDLGTTPGYPSSSRPESSAASRNDEKQPFMFIDPKILKDEVA
ncbi:sushi, von Willebrand factor type A, EGF and pentraxin domain-containing protein 1-like [Lytechinus variegatus]|uniref:sushi, von Willebrand factor type A, EGF and pentraxin domain-containing protein 1-like n=1 Tax=Lytechinus variegatus TaxID=7654 RepID=UPI001BB288EF|nr:sushi, von Willebrand factor type A, EGF and pentraxin domain-containing protein 1-like [Lytechinus variegatus]